MIYYEANRANPQNGIYYQKNADLSFYPHLHDSFEVIFVCEGELLLWVDSVSYVVRAGQAILIFPNQIHETKTICSNQTHLYIFENNLVSEFYLLIKNKAARSPIFEIDAKSIIEQMAVAKNSRYQLKAILYNIIDKFDKDSGGYYLRNNSQTDLPGKILVYIAEHCTKNISMKDIADYLGYDHHYLSNVFQKHLHTTFRTVLNEYRVSIAKQLLISNFKNICDIAYECGYESIVSFNRNFKRVVGLTPSEFRKRFC